MLRYELHFSASNYRLKGMPLADVAAIRAEFRAMAEEARKLTYRRPSGPTPDPGPLPRKHEWRTDKVGREVCRHCKLWRSWAESMPLLHLCIDPATGKRVRW